MPAELDVSDLLVGESDAIRLDHLRSEGLYDADGLHWVIGQAQELIHDDPRASETLCRVLDRAAAELGLADIRAEVRYLQARIVTERGDLDHGLLLIGQAREAWLRAGQPTAALRTELGRMQILDDLGRHGDALEVGQQLVAEVEAIEPEADDYPLARAIRAHAIDNIGTAYGLLGSHEQALQAYAQAEAEYAELGLVLDAARPQANRGVELLALGRAREALLELDAAVGGVHARRGPDLRGQVSGLPGPGPRAARTVGRGSGRALPGAADAGGARCLDRRRSGCSWPWPRST